jgi:hypothetical protein
MSIRSSPHPNPLPASGERRLLRKAPAGREKGFQAQRDQSRWPLARGVGSLG